jgi:hypothetical protein
MHSEAAVGRSIDPAIADAGHDLALAPGRLTVSPRQTDRVSVRLGTRLRWSGPGHEGSPMPTATTEPVGLQDAGSPLSPTADVCLRMAEQALSPYDEEWLRLAAKWTRLARQAELKVRILARSLDRVERA